MNRLLAASLICLAIVVVPKAYVAGTRADEPIGPPIVLELFTSQGCSSCPPADRLLRHLAKERDLITLSFHVDYWNHLGWRDPFSSAAWTQRQRSYAQHLRSPTVYTPMLVVNGRAHYVGSDQIEIEKAIVGQRERSELLRLEPLIAPTDEGSVSVSVRWPEATVPSGLELVIFTTEGGISTAVRRGENGGRELAHDSVVRNIHRVELDSLEVDALVEIDDAWDRSELSFVVLAQKRHGFTLHAAGQSPLES